MSNKKNDKVELLAIGKSIHSYPRNRVLLKALEKNFKVETVELGKANFLGWRMFRTLWSYRKRADSVIVFQVAQELAWPLLVYRFMTFFRQRLIIDAFISLYDSFVKDRKLTPQVSLKALYYYLNDFLVCHLADILIFDTQSHQDYFTRTFKLRKKTKKVTLPVSLDLDLIEKSKESQQAKFPNNRFNVLFCGYYIPLQGIEYILEAASLLKEEKKIFFTLVGNGQTRREMEALKDKLELENMVMLNSVSYEELLDYNFQADLCLGIFGSSDKATRVIPNKILEAMACEKIVVTGRNQEMIKYFKDREELIYCNLADSQDLALKIKMVYDNYESLKGMGKKAKEAVKKDFSLPSLVLKVKKDLK